MMVKTAAIRSCVNDTFLNPIFRYTLEFLTTPLFNLNSVLLEEKLIGYSIRLFQFKMIFRILQFYCVSSSHLLQNVFSFTLCLWCRYISDNADTDSYVIRRCYIGSSLYEISFLFLTQD